MAAAPVHYIRTIHTSFTAAHPHSSSAWATHASASSMSRVHTHSNILQTMSINYTNSPPTSKYPPGLGAPMGRKRSASIRVAPPAYAQPRIQRVKFDPFAEESESSPPSTTTTLVTTSSVLYNSAYHQHQPHPTARSSTTRPASMPYTIQIPPAAPADIQRHHQQQQQYRQQQQQQQGVRIKQQQATPQPVQRVPTPVVAVTTAPAPAAAFPRPQNTITTANREREARSKIVAGILLNRVHAVGKPMRRRVTEQPRAYVPSGLSTCISTEA